MQYQQPMRMRRASTLLAACGRLLVRMEMSRRRPDTRLRRDRDFARHDPWWNVAGGESQTTRSEHVLATLKRIPLIDLLAAQPGTALDKLLVA